MKTTQSVKAAKPQHISDLINENLLCRQIINSGQNGIIVYGSDLRYQVWNPVMEKMSGMPANEVIGKHPMEVFPFLNESGLIQRLERAIAGEAQETLAISFKVSQTGRNRWASDTSGPLQNEKGEIIGVIGIVQDVTERKNAEESLIESEKTLHSLSRKLISLQEEERAKISRQLHDDLGQRLTALALELELLLIDAGGNKSEIERILKNTTDTIALLRRICASLRPQTLDDIGLFSALNILIGDFSTRSGIQVKGQFKHTDRCEECRRVHMPVYRVVQEALDNIARHSSANNVIISLEHIAEAGCVLKIIDDGKGFSADERRNGFGILGMKERAAICGGELHIESVLGKGTEVRITIPCDAIEPGGGGI